MIGSRRQVMTDSLYMYTDAAHNQFADLSGYGIVFDRRTRREFLSGCLPLESIDRTELHAVVLGLRQIGEPSAVVVYTDSLYVLGRWAGRQGNGDLWYQLDRLCRKHDVQMRHVKAHSGDEFNELADRLAREATYGNFVKTFRLWV